MFRGKVEIINLGVRGYDIIQEYRQLLEIGLSYKPDLAIQILNQTDYEKLDNHLISVSLKSFRPSYSIEGGQFKFLAIPPKKMSMVTENRWVVRIKDCAYHSVVVRWFRERIAELPAFQKLRITAGIRKANGLDEKEDTYVRDYRKAVELIYQEWHRLEQIHHFCMLIVWSSSDPIPL